MPTYSYRCQACGKEFEEFHSISAPALTVCRDCGGKLERGLGGGSAVMVKHGRSSAPCDRSAPCCGRSEWCGRSCEV